MRLVLSATAVLCAVTCLAEAVCFSGLGCFSNEPPWNSAERPVPPPRSPHDINTYFTLYTRRTQYTGYNISTWPTITLEGSDFMVNRTTVFIVPGLTALLNITWLYQLKNNVLNKGDYNVVLTHWGRGGDPSFNYTYYQAISDTRVVGSELARLGRALINELHASPGNFHIIGHSLGAQIAGYMGQNITGIGRITGLDTTQVGFLRYPQIVRLDSSDAELVEDIHTALQPPIPNLKDSLNLRVGHVDFYVNGGNVQPGCNLLNHTLNFVADYASLTPAEVRNMSGCSHMRSIAIFLEATSSSDCVFWGRKWQASPGANAADRTAPCRLSTCRPIGFDLHHSTARGSFDVITAATEPYCGMKTVAHNNTASEKAKLFRFALVRPRTELFPPPAAVSQTVLREPEARCTPGMSVEESHVVGFGRDHLLEKLAVPVPLVGGSTDG